MSFRSLFPAKSIHLNLLLAAPFVVAALSLSACGGGEGKKANRPAQDYALDVTVTGLLGTLVLQNNGEDDLVISEDGTFTFAAALADEESYDVTVGAQPDGQTCTVSNGSGTVSGADVTDVTVECGVAGTNTAPVAEDISVSTTKDTPSAATR